MERWEICHWIPEYIEKIQKNWKLKMSKCMNKQRTKNQNLRRKRKDKRNKIHANNCVEENIKIDNVEENKQNKTFK